MAHYIKQVYTNKQCIKIKEELIESIGNRYDYNTVYETKGQKWYINTKGYVHFIDKNYTDWLLTNKGTLKC